MLVKRLPLLSAFAGGCLSTAALFGFWDADSKPSAAVASGRDVSALLSTIEAAPAVEPEVQAEPVRAPVADGSGSSEPSGSSVADLLARLETAYQEVSSAKATAPVTADAAASADARPETTAVPAASSTPVAAMAGPAEAPVPSPAPTQDPAPAPRAESVAEPVMAAAAPTAPAPVTFVGEVHQNIHLSDEDQGDRYRVEQLAVIQYLQLLALTSYAGMTMPQTRHVPPGRTLPSRQIRRVPPPIISIPNPDNPWGFSFPPPALVK